VHAISEERQSTSIYAHLDRFQFAKKGRLRALLMELENMKEIGISKWLSHTAIRYGIRRATALEYLREWEDGGYIVIKDDVIKFVKGIED
jgi:hypothetical protein